MNNIAAIGEEIKVGSYTLNGDMQTAAELIQAGAEALTTTDTGEVKVNVGKIGFDFWFFSIKQRPPPSESSRFEVYRVRIDLFCT